MSGSHVTGIIMKPVSNACNLRCQYCYADGHSLSQADVMPVSLAKKIIREALDQEGLTTLELIWHGGEPLLRGISFYREVFDYVSEITPTGVCLRHALQTNVMLLSHEWMSFLKEWNVNISTSLDGPEWIHDKNRIDAKGAGTYVRVTENIAMARAANIKVNVIAVVTDYSSGYANEIYDHLAHLDVNHIGFLPCFVLNSQCQPVAPTITPGRYGKFLCDVFDLFMSRRTFPNVREFEQAMQFFTGGNTNLCNFNGSCHNFVCVAADGGVYSCDTSPLGSEYLFGNVNEKSFLEVLDGSVRARAIMRTNEVCAQCSKCRFWAGCNGGCPNQRNDGSFYFCEDRRLLYTHIESCLVELVDRLSIVAT